METLEFNKNFELSKHAKYFIMLVGLPGSGKSTWLQGVRNTQIIMNTGVSFDVISTDDIIEKIAKDRGLTYSDVWSESIKGATKGMHENFQNAIRHNHNVIWDQTNCTSKKRKSVIVQVPNDYYKVAVVFNTPLDEIERRLKARALETGKNIPKSVLLNMYDTFEQPTHGEGFDFINQE
jgi:predicted kinase